MKGERGAILLQVLVVAMVAALMCATILRARFQPALTAAAGLERISSGLAAQGAVNRVTEVWSRLGTCTTALGAGVNCSGSGCACTCAVSATAPGAYAATVASSPAGGACALKAVGQ